MFTGIVECLGVVDSITVEEGNKHFRVRSPFSNELKVDQSVSHNGVCLTVTRLEEGAHWVTAVHETLRKTDLDTWQPGDLINLERCLKIGDRLDGHWVQGHVDTTGICLRVAGEDGSWKFHFQYADPQSFKTVPKGSITVNGISLTVIDSEPGLFSVAVIPYTWEHTNLKFIKPGDTINLEFDVIGKWVKAWMQG